eukprot:10960266-Lingulodinium_polyedra.AAC.1
MHGRAGDRYRDPKHSRLRRHDVDVLRADADWLVAAVKEGQGGREPKLDPLLVVGVPAVIHEIMSGTNGAR